MSRELLKRALDLIGNSSNVFYEKLAKDIETYLAQPEPEPVAWIEVGHPMDGPYNCHFMAILPKGKHHVYLEQPDQSAQINELSQSDKNCLEAEIINTQRELIKAQEYIKELATEHSVLVVKNRDLEQQLADLQAKREPLSDDEIQDIHNELPSRSTYYEFARAIEAAHGIGTNHD